jgi:hypothetical protein
MALLGVRVGRHIRRHLGARCDGLPAAGAAVVAERLQRELDVMVVGMLQG